MIFGGQVWPIGGTSASGPIFAGLVSLLNEHRLNHGLPPVGYEHSERERESRREYRASLTASFVFSHVGPLLYDLYAKHPQVFNDVIVGDNVRAVSASLHVLSPSGLTLCSQRHGDLQFRGSSFPSFCEYGFYTLPGWDAVTGLGTPNWGEMQKHVNDFAKKN